MKTRLFILILISVICVLMCTAWSVHKTTIYRRQKKYIADIHISCSMTG